MTFPLEMNLEDHSKKLHSKSFNQLKKLTARLDLDHDIDSNRYSAFKIVHKIIEDPVLLVK